MAAVTCSGHGRAYLDGLVVDGSPVCECNYCLRGLNCSQFSPDCVADVDWYVYFSHPPQRSSGDIVVQRNSKY